MPATPAALPLDPGSSAELAAVFKALGDPVRLLLLSRIACAAEDGVCVCDLTRGFKLTGPTISHHLRLLREAGLIDGRRRGTWIYYRATSQRLDAVAGFLASAAAPVAQPVAGPTRRPEPAPPAVTEPSMMTGHKAARAV